MLQEWHNLWDTGVGGCILHLLALSGHTQGLSDTLLQRGPSRLSQPTIVEPISHTTLLIFLPCLPYFHTVPMLSAITPQKNNLHQNPLYRSAVGEIPVKTIRPSSGGFYVRKPQGFVKNLSWLRLINTLLPVDSQLQLIALGTLA